ncbi:tripartite tricarboxylate transporter substrate binding protein [Pseudonocardia nematodicida]|uniref:Tripartite tricarboxylate transporter substrate binding protein n=1 Tax=Pseudonocardia nematodicida TaxID=1206997 RepID=A0ABV1KGA8_9PSEU
MLAQHLDGAFAGNVVVVNETAGGGALAVNTVARSRPDGYSLLFFHEAMHTGYQQGTVRQTAEELRPIATTARQHQYLLASSASGWADLDDLADAARADPGGLTMGVSFGQTTQYTGAMLEDAAGIDIRMQDTGNEADRVAGLLSGQLQLIVGSTATARQYLATGDFVALAVTSPERDPVLSEIPTAAEQGYDVEFPLNFSLLGPEETPDEVVAAWTEALRTVSTNPDYRRSMAEVAEPVSLDAAETEEQLRTSAQTVAELSRLVTNSS